MEMDGVLWCYSCGCNVVLSLPTLKMYCMDRVSCGEAFQMQLHEVYEALGLDPKAVLEAEGWT